MPVASPPSTPAVTERPRLAARKLAGREREEEPVRVQRREHERHRVEGEVQHGVVRAAIAEERPRELARAPRRRRRAATSEMRTPATSVDPVTQASACASAGYTGKNAAACGTSS